MTISIDTINNTLQQHNVYVKSTADTGRSVYTSRSFTRGDIVLYDLPYTHILHPRHQPTHCDYCYKSNNEIDSNHPDNLSVKISLTRCSQCKFVYYCSKPCQLSAWQSYHKLECKILRDATNELLHIPHDSLCDLLLSCRIIRKIHGNKSDDANPLTIQQSHYQYTCDIFDAIANHIDPKSLIKYSDQQGQYNKISGMIDYKQVSYQLIGNRELARLILSLPPLVSTAATRELIENILIIMQCNNFSVVDDLLIERGAGVYLYGSLLNSSCCPNTTISYETMTINNIEYQHVQIFRALCDIPCDTEITHSYTDIASLTATRQNTLAQRYYYKCECIRCMQPYNESNDRYLQGNIDGSEILLCDSHQSHQHNIDNDIERQLQNADELQSKAEHSTINDNTSTAPHHELKWMKQCMDIRNKLLHKIHVRSIQTAGQVVNAALLVKDYELATDACQQLCDKYRIVYKSLDNNQSQTYHPLLGLQLYTLGSLYEQLNQLQSACDILQESLIILTVTHGTNSRLVKQLHQHVAKLKKQLNT